MPIATMNAGIAINTSSGTVGQIHAQTPAAAVSGRMRLAARPVVRVQHIFERMRRRRMVTREHPLDHFRNLQERQPSLQKRFDSHFIRGVQYRRSRAARLGRRARQSQARKPGCVGSFEIQPRGPQNVEGFYTRGDALRPAERVGDRRAHVGIAQLRQHRAVDVFDQRVHDALRMHHHFDLRRRQAEQQAGFDLLQSLVHQRGRVHGDFSSHHPTRMRAGLFGRDCAQRAGRRAQERPARGCQQNTSHVGAGAAATLGPCMHWKTALCSLSTGSSVAPPSRTACMNNGPDITSASLFASMMRLPALAAARLERRPAAPTIAAMTASTSSCAATSLNARLAHQHSRGGTGAVQFGAELGCSRRVDDHGESRTMREALLTQARHVAVGGEREHFVAIRMTGKHVERAQADAAGRAQYRDSRFRAGRSSQQPQPLQADDKHRRGRSDAVDAIEHAAVTGQQAAAVLQSRVAFEQALGEIADHRGDRDHQAQRS